MPEGGIPGIGSKEQGVADLQAGDGKVGAFGDSGWNEARRTGEHGQGEDLEEVGKASG